MAWWIPVAMAAASALSNQQNKGSSKAVTVGPRLDITDAEKRVFEEQTGSRTPYEPFLPYMLGSGGVGRQFGTPAYTPQYTDSLRAMAAGQGPNLPQTLGGPGAASLLPQTVAPYGDDQGLIPQHAQGGQYYFNQFATQPTQAPWPLQGPHYGGSGPQGRIKPGEDYDEWKEEGGVDEPYVPVIAPGTIGVGGVAPGVGAPPAGAVRFQQMIGQGASPAAAAPVGYQNPFIGAQVAGGHAAPQGFGGYLPGWQVQPQIGPAFLPQAVSDEEEDNTRLIRANPDRTDDLFGTNQYWDRRRKTWRTAHPEAMRKWAEQGRIDYVR